MPIYSLKQPHKHKRLSKMEQQTSLLHLQSNRKHSLYHSSKFQDTNPFIFPSASYKALTSINKRHPYYTGSQHHNTFKPQNNLSTQSTH